MLKELKDITIFTFDEPHTNGNVFNYDKSVYAVIELVNNKKEVRCEYGQRKLEGLSGKSSKSIIHTVNTIHESNVCGRLYNFKEVFKNGVVSITADFISCGPNKELVLDLTTQKFAYRLLSRDDKVLNFITWDIVPKITH